MTWYIGCDPGMEGAVAGIPVGEGLPECKTFVLDIPRTKDKKSIDIDLLYRSIMRVLRDPTSPIHICLEEVTATPTFGAVGCFRLGRALGALESMALRMGPARYFTVRPQVWKKMYGLLRSSTLSGPEKKAMNLEYARRYFGPEVATFLTRAKDHNRADALLLAEYARRIHLV